MILASLASDQGLAFVQEHAAAIRAELTWVSTAPPRLFLRAFSPERLRAHEQRRRVLRMVSRLASTTTTIRTRCAEASAIRVRALAHRLPAS